MPFGVSAEKGDREKKSRANLSGSDLQLMGALCLAEAGQAPVQWLSMTTKAKRQGTDVLRVLSSTALGASTVSLLFPRGLTLPERASVHSSVAVDFHLT